MAVTLDMDPEIDDAITPEDLKEWDKEFKEINKRIAGLDPGRQCKQAG